MHTFFDGFDIEWGRQRLTDYYISWCGDTIPIMMYDGYWYWTNPGDFTDGLRERLNDPTDVTISLTAVENRDAVWTVMAEVCIEPGGAGKRMRIYTADTLDHYPYDSEHWYYRNTVRQVAPTQDVDLDPGQCAIVESTFEFDATSWSQQEDIRIVAWAQETADHGPASVFQAAQMGWPFPQAGSAEPEYPRDFRFSLPLYDGDFSAWLEDARPAAVLADSDEQLQATYQVLCGDISGLYPVDDPPTTSQPIPQVRTDAGALPIFAAGAGSQQVLLCDYAGFVQHANDKWGVSTEGGPVTVPACAGTVRPSGPEGTDSDGYLVLVGGATAYDFWQATTVRQGECQSEGAGLPGPAILEASQADFADLGGSGANPSGVRSARPAGTPLLAGAILPEDVESGDIAHALAVAIPGLRNQSANPASPLAADVVYPASSTDGQRYSINDHALAAGQRLRMRGTLVGADGVAINEQGLAPITKMFLRALRRYGAYVVDTADGFAFFAEDTHTGVLELSDAQINTLIGEPAGTPLPSDRTRWQLVMDTLNQELAGIPFAAGPCSGVATTVETANFIVVEPAAAPPTPGGGMRRISGRLIPGAP